MWTRRQIKKQARGTFKGNYLRIAIVCLLLSIFAGAYSSNFSAANTGQQQGTRIRFQGATSTDIVNQFVGNILEAEDPVIPLLEQNGATRGALAAVFNNVTRSGSFAFGTLNALNQFIFGDKIAPGIIILVGTAIMFLYWMLVGNILRVGECRFFMENHLYRGTKVDRILYLYRIGRVRHVARVMFFRTFYIVLWYLTIVGGVIKTYSYRMVPYILAEDPEIPQREAFRQSARMMKGHKWKAFVLDLSFIGWSLVSVLTLGLASYVFVNPYRTAVNTELYFRLRENMAAEPGYLYDPWLDAPPEYYTDDEYPMDLFPVPFADNWAWLAASHDVKYSFSNLVLIFFTFCMGGWLWEVFVELASFGDFVNRGTLYGPWLPIYGVGGVLIILLFRRWASRPVLTFGLIVAMCAALEYFTSWVLEKITGAAWWDYSGYFLNLNGRICLEGLLVFGIAGCLGIYFFGPALNNLYSKVPKKLKFGLCAVLLTLFAADAAFSLLVKPNTAAAVPAPGSAAASGVSSGSSAPQHPARAQWPAKP
ncbi:DUF975 family protein [Ruminococcaceae bacterium OttesenSCG-928-O06]|nr:DUF975 family protein [Ruminococcaceae bacterium OttesenSCG-928-O06]